MVPLRIASDSCEGFLSVFVCGLRLTQLLCVVIYFSRLHSHDGGIELYKYKN